MSRFYWKYWTAKHRFMFAAIFPAILMFVGISAFTIYARISEVTEETEEVGQMAINGLSPLVRDDLTHHEYQRIRTYLSKYTDASDQILSIVVRDINGQSIATFRANNTSDSRGERLVFRQLMSAQNSDAPVGSLEVLVSTDGKQARQKVRLTVWVIFGGLILLGSVVFGFDVARSVNRPIEDLIASVEKIGRGELIDSSTISERGQFGDLQRKIYEMSLYVNDFRNQLESEVKQRTQELENQKAIVIDSNRVKTILIQKLNTIAEAERKNIASELHDEINSQLIGIRLPLHSLIKIAEELPSTAEHVEIIQNAMAATTHLASMHRAVRDLCKRLRPESIDVMGLRGAIESLVLNQNRLHPSCRYFLHLNDDLEKLTESSSLHVFRLIQESITNVSKHAEATTCTINVGSLENGYLKITIADNGKGFSTEERVEGIGLVGMKERVESMNGSMVIDSTQSGGTKISFIVPTNDLIQ